MWYSNYSGVINLVVLIFLKGNIMNFMFIVFCCLVGVILKERLGINCMDLIFFDLDGILLNKFFEIFLFIKEMLGLFGERDIVFIVVMGCIMYLV